MRILIVEDELRISAFVGRGLRAEGFVVHVAVDGREGLERALSGTYDLVILDLVLPCVDGLTLLREVHRRVPELPVLILSGRRELAARLRAFGLGANDFLTKPFSFDELLARVRVQLRRDGAVRGTTLRAGGLVLDVPARRAQLAGRVVDLSDREFRLLRHLLENAGEVVSRERLLAHVWGYHFDPRSNVVDVYVGRLRRKLGPEAPIETVRYAGYRVSAA